MVFLLVPSLRWRLDWGYREQASTRLGAQLLTRESTGGRAQGPYPALEEERIVMPEGADGTGGRVVSTADG